MGELARYRDVREEITDRLEAVVLYLAHLHSRGELVSYGPTRPVVDANGWVTIRYVRRELAPRPAVVARPVPARWSVRRRIAVAAAVIVPAGLLVGAALWWLWTHPGVVLAAVVLLVGGSWIGLGQAGACPGLHCPGCKCR